jgi:hypothetical protein
VNASERNISGRIGIVALVALAILAIGLYLYSERAAPPQPGANQTEPERSAAESTADPISRPGPGNADPTTTVPTGTGPPPSPVEASSDPPDRSPPTEVSPAEPEPSLAESAARLRVAIAERLSPGELELLASDRLLERIVTTVHSLDGDPVPLRFRPLAHVPDLPRVIGDGEGRQLPVAPDPRYDRYRELFDSFDAATLAALFGRHEDALEVAWRRLGESEDTTFRQRTVDVLRHLARFEVPEQRPMLHRPEVLYEFVDPRLEALSWGRKILIRVGPEHAAAVQRRAAELAQRLSSEGSGEGD